MYLEKWYKCQKRERDHIYETEKWLHIASGENRRDAIKSIWAQGNLFLCFLWLF